MFLQSRRFDLLLAGSLILIQGCTTAHLRKFEDGDIGKEMSADMAKKFEVKDVSAPEPSPAPEVKGKKSKKKKETKVVAVKVIPQRRPEALPFQVGERLAYDIRYIGVTAAHVEMSVLPEKQVNTRTVFPIQAKIKTVPVFELVYRVNDTVISYWDSQGMFSHRFTMDLDESKQSRKLIELYDYDKNKSFFWNRIDHVEKGFMEQKETYDIKPWSQDPLSSMYFMRVSALPTDPAVEFRYPTVLDGKPWETALRFLRKETIYAAGQDREALVYHIDNYQNGELKNRDNTLWISNDSHRYILRLETKVKVGSFAVALDKIL
jgi:hypothetical protein